MATLSSSRFYDLIQRFFTLRQNSPRTVFSIVRVEYPAVRRLAQGDVPSSGTADRVWLKRAELRGHEAVTRLLESREDDLANSILVLFLDERCGLIASRQIHTPVDINIAEAVSGILSEGSCCHASGVILASNHQNRALNSGKRRQRLTMEIYRKGEAIDMFLLDHFVLAKDGWKRMFAVREGERH